RKTRWSLGQTVLLDHDVKLLSSIQSDTSLVEEDPMKVQLTPQVQELLGKSDLVVITERVDDVALLMGQMVTMGFVEVLDRHLPRHWQQRELSWGWTAVRSEEHTSEL